MNAVIIVPFATYLEHIHESDMQEIDESPELKEVVRSFMKGNVFPVNSWVLKQLNGTHLYYTKLSEAIDYIENPKSDCHVRYLAKPGTPPVFPGQQFYANGFVNREDAYNVRELEQYKLGTW